MKEYKKEDDPYNIYIIYMAYKGECEEICGRNPMDALKLERTEQSGAPRRNLRLATAILPWKDGEWNSHIHPYIEKEISYFPIIIFQNNKSK